MFKYSMILFSGLIILLTPKTQANKNGYTTPVQDGDILKHKNIERISNVISTTTLFSNPNTLSESGFYQNSTSNNPYLPGNHHGLLIHMDSYWDDNYNAQLYFDYSTPHGITSPHIWYRFSNANGYTSWYQLWSKNDDGTGSGMDADLIRGQVPQWETNGSTICTTNSGNVGIGTTIAQSKLAVNGTVTATKVKVTQTGWPDYVLDSTYNLPRLSSIETYIKANHHLPDISPTAEINKNGLDLGKMQKKQMQKIEEIMLYLIKMGKKQTILEKQIKELKTSNQQLLKRIKQLKSMSK